MRSRNGEWALLLLLFVFACGGNRAGDAPTTAKPETKAAPDAGTSAADAGAERPFAGSANDATQLIQQALDKFTDDMNKCVKEFRFRKHLAHERVDVAV